MKHLIVLISFLLIGLFSIAQSNQQYTNKLSSNDVKEIKKAKDTIKKQCIKIDTMIAELKNSKIMRQEIITILRERKQSEIKEQ